MNRDKQIKEMAKIMRKRRREISEDTKGLAKLEAQGKTITDDFAEVLYDAGYRKASDITELEEKLADVTANWQKIHDAYTEDCREHYNKGRSDVAREIFEEIEDVLVDMCMAEDAYIPYPFTFLEELKKKYEVTDDEQRKAD